MRLGGIGRTRAADLVQLIQDDERNRVSGVLAALAELGIRKVVVREQDMSLYEAHDVQPRLAPTEPRGEVAPLCAAEVL